MLFYEFNVGEKQYKLRLNTRNIVSLEKALGCNPLSIFGNGDRIPTITEMVAILHNSLQQYQHNITINDSYEIFDKWLEDNAVTDFIPVILEVYKVSGIISVDSGEGDEEKN